MITREPRDQLLKGQTVLVLGGSAGIGLETARRARDEGADLILPARDPDRLHTIGLELGASISAFDLNDSDRLTGFFASLPGPVNHVFVSGAGPQYLPFAELDIGKIRQGVERIVLPYRSPAWRRMQGCQGEACC